MKTARPNSSQEMMQRMAMEAPAPFTKLPDYLRDARPGMSSNNVEVKFMRKDNKFFFRVELRSEVKPAHKVHMDVIFSANMEKILMEAGGALAAHQNDINGDQHDPGEVAKVAWEAYRELKEELSTKQPHEIDPKFSFKLFAEQ